MSQIYCVLSVPHPLLVVVVLVVVWVVLRRVLGGVRLRLARQVHQLGLGAQRHEALLADVAALIRQVLGSLHVQTNLIKRTNGGVNLKVECEWLFSCRKAVRLA